MKKESIYLVLAFFILCAHSLYANKKRAVGFSKRKDQVFLGFG